MTGHTPGPWEVFSGTIIEANGRFITRTLESYEMTDDGSADVDLFDEMRANARLIAAAKGEQR